MLSISFSSLAVTLSYQCNNLFILPPVIISANSPPEFRDPIEHADCIDVNNESGMVLYRSDVYFTTDCTS